MNIYLVISSSSYEMLHLFYSYTCMKPNILISMKEYLDKYTELLKLIKNVSPFVNKIILDSGGFSTFDIKDVKVAEIMKNKYLNFIEKYYNYTHETFEYIFAFDYIHGSINFKLNYEWFDEQCSVNEMVVPVVHNISKDSKEVDEYSVYHPKHIAIGKCQNKTNIDLLKPVIDNIRKNSKFHFLGITTPKILTKITVDNCDSKSWIDYSKSGKLMYSYLENDEIKSDTVFFKKYENKSYSGTIPFDDYTKKDEILKIGKLFGKEYKDFFNDNQNETLMLCSLYNYMTLQDLVNKIYTSRETHVTQN